MHYTTYFLNITFKRQQALARLQESSKRGETTKEPPVQSGKSSNAPTLLVLHAPRHDTDTVLCIHMLYIVSLKRWGRWVTRATKPWRGKSLGCGNRACCVRRTTKSFNRWKFPVNCEGERVHSAPAALGGFMQWITEASRVRSLSLSLAKPNTLV